LPKLIQLQNVSKQIGKKKIIDGLSFVVYEGEVFGFLGPNGAGKTTTIRMMVGLMNITEGDIIICGKSVKTNFEQALQHVGAIVENPELYPFLSGYKNLVHFARMSKNVSKEKINEVVQLVGLSDRIHDKVKNYSLGMRQRLGLAQCLLHDPKVLILDEPTNGLDPAGIREIRDYVRKLAKEKRMAIIVSSHLLSEMEMMCDRIAIIQKGKLVGVQTVEEFVSDHQKTYRFEINLAPSLETIMQTNFPDYSFIIKDSYLEIKLEREQVPTIIRTLVEQGVHIYSVQPVKKSLEERFLEVTEKEGEVQHA
jgi:ABC-2 type transport system ATP-binding protein